MKASAKKQSIGTLVVGLGSPHGDDQAGWKVIERLVELQLRGVELRQATVPHDLIDWLEGQTAMHLIDGCVCNGLASDNHDLTHQRFEVVEVSDAFRKSLRLEGSKQRPSAMATIERPIELRSGGSHQIDAFSVLALAECLNRLPKQVVLWAIPGERFEPGEAITAACANAISSCVSELVEELSHA